MDTLTYEDLPQDVKTYTEQAAEKLLPVIKSPARTNKTMDWSAPHPRPTVADEATVEKMIRTGMISALARRDVKVEVFSPNPKRFTYLIAWG